MKLNKESMTENLDYPFKTSNKRIDPFSPSPKKKKNKGIAQSWFENLSSI
jgi:hypothetical protein